MDTLKKNPTDLKKNVVCSFPAVESWSAAKSVRFTLHLIYQTSLINKTEIEPHHLKLYWHAIIKTNTYFWFLTSHKHYPCLLQRQRWKICSPSWPEDEDGNHRQRLRLCFHYNSLSVFANYQGADIYRCCKEWGIHYVFIGCSYGDW